MATKGKWSSSVVESVSGEAQSLFAEFKAQLEPRLAAGLIDGLSADTAEFLGKRVEAGNALNTLKTATKEQNAAIAHALAVLRPARASVNATTAKEKSGAFGVSKAINADKVTSVLEAVEGFLHGAAKYPEVVRGAGLLTADLEGLRAVATSLATADRAQEKQKQARKAPTLNRNALQARIEGAIAAISRAGQIAFVGKPDTAERFKGLIPSSSKPSAKKAPVNG